VKFLSTTRLSIAALLSALGYAGLHLAACDASLASSPVDASVAAPGQDGAPSPPPPASDAGTDATTTLPPDAGTSDTGSPSTDAATDSLGPIVLPAVFWTESNAVMSAQTDGGGLRVIAGAPLAPDGGVGPGTMFPDGIGVDSNAQKLYWADDLSDSITMANYDGSEAVTVYHNANPYSNPAAIAVDSAAGRIFWVESNAVMSATLDGGTVRAVAGAPLTADGGVGPGTMFPGGVAVNAAAQQLYWADTLTDSITVANYDGSDSAQIYRNANPYSNPAAIAVDGTAGRIFWVESNAVMTAALDGGAPQPVVGAPLMGGSDAGPGNTSFFPDGVATFPTAARLYWADTGSDSITAANYDGSSAGVIYRNANPYSNPSALVIAP
jgi:sugar lactone lactonase YvrE